MRNVGCALIGAATLLAVAANEDAKAWTYKVLYNFCSQRKCHDGMQLLDPLLMDAAGNLYGATVEGGEHHGRGTIFELIHNLDDSWKYKRLHSFCTHHDCGDGSAPNGSLIEDVNGNLYGTTLYGGAHDEGTVFELSPNADRSAWTARVLYSFCSDADCRDGIIPTPLTYAGATAGVAYDGQSPLFGATYYDYQRSRPGVVFELVKKGRRWSEKVIYRFCAGVTDCTPGTAADGVVANATGNLYGATLYDGAHGRGTLFELTYSAGSWSRTVLYDFCQQQQCLDGAWGNWPLVFDAEGNVVGTFFEGGPHGNGGIFKLVPNGVQSVYSVLYGFCSQSQCADGRNANQGVVIGSQGELFGTAQAGGDVGYGTVYGLKNDVFERLYSFCPDLGFCTDGTSPNSALIQDAQGDLFGSTRFGGARDSGVVFELTP
jgi:uncharacterized repeat protein (TIGR03803 family)